MFTRCGRVHAYRLSHSIVPSSVPTARQACAESRCSVVSNVCTRRAVARGAASVRKSVVVHCVVTGRLVSALRPCFLGSLLPLMMWFLMITSSSKVSKWLWVCLSQCPGVCRVCVSSGFRALRGVSPGARASPRGSLSGWGSDADVWGPALPVCGGPGTAVPPSNGPTGRRPRVLTPLRLRYLEEAAMGCARGDRRQRGPV